MTQVGLQKQQEGALFPRGAAHDLSPHSMPALMQHRPATQPEQGAQHSSGEAWRIYIVLIGTMWLRRRFNAAAVTQGSRCAHRAAAFFGCSTHNGAEQRTAYHVYSSNTWPACCSAACVSICVCGPTVCFSSSPCGYFYESHDILNLCC